DRTSDGHAKGVGRPDSAVGKTRTIGCANPGSKNPGATKAVQDRGGTLDADATSRQLPATGNRPARFSSRPGRTGTGRSTGAAGQDQGRRRRQRSGRGGQAGRD